MVGRVPAALTNSSYAVLCLLAGLLRLPPGVLRRAAVPRGPLPVRHFPRPALVRHRRGADRGGRRPARRGLPRPRRRGPYRRTLPHRRLLRRAARAARSAASGSPPPPC
ncbi:hypothetical protein [Streptomyces sp. NPDC001770]